jgi:Fe2+ transport system protein B
MESINKENRNEKTSHNSKLEEAKTQSIDQIQSNKQYGSNYFYHQMMPMYLRSTSLTSSLQDYITDYRNILRKGDGFSAIGAMRTRFNYGLVTRNSINQDIEKAT